MHRYQIHCRNVLERDLYSKILSKNPFTLPKLESITLHISFLGKNKAPLNTRRFFLPAYLALELITGQKPKIIEAKESVANLSLREGDFCALSVKLRKGAMYQFLDSLVNIVLPSMGSVDTLLDTSFDNQGNFSMKIPNLLYFPQLEKEYQHFHPMSSGAVGTSSTGGGKDGDFTSYLPVEISFALKHLPTPLGYKSESSEGKNPQASLEASKLFLKSLHLPYPQK